MKNLKLVMIIILIVVAGGSFYGGMQYQASTKSSSPQSGNDTNSSRLNQFRNRFGSGNQPVNGEVINADDKSITVKLRDGSSKIVLLTDQSKIIKNSEGSKTDLKTGEQVLVSGSSNSDGSITAQNVQINPANLLGRTPQ